MPGIIAWVGVVVVVLCGACDTLGSAAPDTGDTGDTDDTGDAGEADDRCAGAVCPDRIVCASGTQLAHLEGECCRSCEPAPVDAGDGCLCETGRDPVCGDDLELYQNPCFADCAGVDVIAVGTCPSASQFPEGNYGEDCTDDSQCDAPYQCLPAANEPTLSPTRSACATLCQTVEDCPPVVTDHCGDQTLCTEGICGFWFCA